MAGARRSLNFEEHAKEKGRLLSKRPFKLVTQWVLQRVTAG